MITETRNPRSMNLDQLAVLDVLRLMNEEDALVPLAVRDALPAIAQAVAFVVAGWSQGGRLIYVGAGTSGRLAVLDAAECPPTFNTDPVQVQALIAGGAAALVSAIEGAEDDCAQGGKDLEALGLTPYDVVVGIAASGRTPYVLGAVEAARKRGLKTAGLSCNAPAPLLEAVDAPIAVIVGPEVLTGSTRLKAGTAQKLVLNMITTTSMVQLGKVYENLMIDVQPTNEKLRKRARRIVIEATGVSGDEADSLLAAADYEVKTAVFMGLTALDAVTARQRLAETNGHLRRALPEDSTRP